MSPVIVHATFLQFGLITLLCLFSRTLAKLQGCLKEQREDVGLRGWRAEGPVLGYSDLGAAGVSGVRRGRFRLGNAGVCAEDRRLLQQSVCERHRQRHRH